MSVLFSIDMSHIIEEFLGRDRSNSFSNNFTKKYPIWQDFSRVFSFSWAFIHSAFGSETVFLYSEAAFSEQVVSSKCAATSRARFLRNKTG